MLFNFVNFIECKVNLISRLTNQYNLNMMTEQPTNPLPPSLAFLRVWKYLCASHGSRLSSTLLPPNKKLMKYFPGNNTLQTAEHTVQYSTVQYSTIILCKQPRTNTATETDGFLCLLPVLTCFIGHESPVPGLRHQMLEMNVCCLMFI